MSARTYWKLLVLFVVLCQGIIGTIAEKDIDESSELLVRQKRVINRNPGGDVKQPIRNAPYVVQIKEYYRNVYCIGVILSTHVVLTLASCVTSEAVSYRVYSGSAQKLSQGSHITRNNVREIRLSPSYNPFRPEEGIALITVTQPFVFGIATRDIQLYEGPIRPRSYATVSGWGCHASGDPGTAHPHFLRSITVPIISNRDCSILHTDVFTVLDSHICTFDSTGNQYCAGNENGAPLVVEENNVPKLVGIHLWSGRGVAGWTHPDVFINLQYPRYKTWIEQNIRILNHNTIISRNPNHP